MLSFHKKSFFFYSNKIGNPDPSKINCLISQNNENTSKNENDGKKLKAFLLLNENILRKNVHFVPV